MLPPVLQSTARHRLDLSALARRAQDRRRGFQIGPRIRVGGPIGHFGQQLKETVGKGAKLAAPIASFFNPAIGAALYGAGHVLDTSDGGIHMDNLPGLALNAALQVGGGKVASSIASHIPGVDKIADAAKGLFSHLPQGVQTAASAAAKSGLPSPTGINAGASVPGGDASASPGGSSIPEWLKLLGMGGTAVAGVQGYQQSKEAAAAQKAALAANTQIAGQLQSHGTDLIAGADAIRTPAEAAMKARLSAGAPPPVNLSGFADTANPFRKNFGATRPGVPGAPGAPAPAIPAPPAGVLGAATNGGLSTPAGSALAQAAGLSGAPSTPATTPAARAALLKKLAGPTGTVARGA